MQDEISRRSFLRATGVAGAVVAVGEAAPGQADPPVAAPGWVDRPMRWAQLTLVEDDPGQFDLPFWLDYFRRTHSDARLPQRRRLRRLLSDRGPAPPSQPLAGRPRPVRRAGRRLPQARHGRPRADRPARDLRRRPRGASRLDRRRRRGPAAPALGLARDVGHLRPRAVQLRVHDRGPPGDHDALQGRRHLHQPLGRLRHVLLRALPGELPGRDRARAAADGRPAGPGAAGVHRSGSRSASSSSGGSGTRRSARSTPTRASSRTPGAARPARST